jgi:hypothetical protein
MVSTYLLSGISARHEAAVAAPDAEREGPHKRPRLSIRSGSAKNGEPELITVMRTGRSDYSTIKQVA